MAAPIAVLESLLARVQKRALEPRASLTPARRSAAPQLSAVGYAPAGAGDVDEEIEDYDDDLEEIVEEPARAPAPLPARASAVVQRREPQLRTAAEWAKIPRTALPLTMPSVSGPASTSGPSFAPPPRAFRLSAAPEQPSAPLAAKVVARSPVVSRGPVAQNVGAPPAGDGESFIALLEASLELARS